MKMIDYEIDALNETKAYFLENLKKNKLSKKETKISKVMANFNQMLEDKDLYKKLLEGMQYLLNLSSNCGTLIVQEKRVLKKAVAKKVEEIKLFELNRCEKVCQKLYVGQQIQHVTFGVATGSLGLPGLAVDLAASPALNNKSMLEIGIAYGFDRFGAQLNGVTALLLDSINDTMEKVELLALLKTAKKVILKKIEEKSEENLTELFLKTLFKSDTAARTLLTVFEKLGIKVTEKSLGKIVPVIGGVFGGALSLRNFNHLKTLLQHHFRLIWLKERDKLSEEEYNNILLGK
jgi:hypothetical protein